MIQKKIIDGLKAIFLFSLCFLVGCGFFFDNATKFRTAIEEEASSFSQSEDLNQSDSTIKQTTYFPYSKSPYHLILIPEKGASKSDLLKKKVPVEIVNGIFKQMSYLDGIGDNYIAGQFIIVWDKKRNGPSWTGSNIQSHDILYVNKEVEETKIILEKVGNNIKIISLE